MKTTTSTTVPPAGGGGGGGGGSGSGGGGGGGGTAPSTSSPTTSIYTVLTASGAPGASNSILDSGQPATMTISAPSGGITPYTYQWYSGASATCTSDSPVAGQTGLAYTAVPTSNIYYCVQEMDSASSVVYTATTLVTVNPTFIASSAPTTPNSVISSGQSSALTIVAPTTGTPPYSYQWYSGTSSVCASDSPTGFTGLSHTFTSIVSSTYYCVQETDSASTNSIVYTVATSVTVSSGSYVAPTVTISNPANTVLDSGQSFTVNGVTANGLSPYTINVVVSNALIPTKIVANIQFGTSASTWSATFTANSPFISNSPVRANVILKDSNSMTVNSIYTADIYVNTQLAASGAPAASNTVINSGGSSTLTAVAPTTGTPGYTYLWYSGPSATCASDSSTGFTGLSHTFTSIASTTYYCVQETDSATTHSIVYTGTTLVTVNSGSGSPSGPWVLGYWPAWRSAQGPTATRPSAQSTSRTLQRSRTSACSRQGAASTAPPTASTAPARQQWSTQRTPRA